MRFVNAPAVAEVSKWSREGRDVFVEVASVSAEGGLTANLSITASNTTVDADVRNDRGCVILSSLQADE